MDRLADGADRLGEILDAVDLRHVARFEMNLGDAPIVALDEAVENLGEEAALLAPEPAHDAKIDDDDAPLGVDEEIALMHVGVKEAVAQGMAQERLNERPPERRRIETQLGEAPRIAERRAVDPLHRQRFARRAIPVDLGRAKAGIVREVLGKLRGRRRFKPQVHLDTHAARQRLDNFDEAQPFQARLETFGAARGIEHVGKIAREASLDAGPQQLDRDLALAIGVAHAGAVDLRNRRGGHRLAEFDIERVDLGAEGRLHCADGSGAIGRRHAVLQLLQFAGDFGADVVGSRREELAEFDVRRPEPVDRRRQAVGAAGATPRHKIGKREWQAGERG